MPNVYVFDPSTQAADIQAAVAHIFSKMESNPFGSERFVWNGNRSTPEGGRVYFYQSEMRFKGLMGGIPRRATFGVLPLATCNSSSKRLAGRHPLQR